MPNNASALVAYGSYTSDALARTIEIQPGVDRFVLRNRTDWGDDTAVTNVQSEFQRGQTAGTAQGFTQAVTTSILSAEAVTTGGFSFIDSYADDVPGAELSASAISTATPAVVSSAATTGLSDGDIVRIYNASTGEQINGYDFTIDSLIANTSFELQNIVLGSAGGTANYRRLPFDLNWYPRRRLITAVTQATSAIVTFSVTHGYVVGEKVRFKVSSTFGMTELNDLVGEVTAVGAADANGFTNTITVNIDSSAFTAFAFPTTATAALGFTPAQCVPEGEVATILTAASQNNGFSGVNIGTNVCGPNAAVMDWWAFKADVNI